MTVTVVILVSPEEHFVDRHRSSLIQRISSVAAILDQLLDQKVVSQEQYDTILAKATQQNQVRKTRGKDIFLSKSTLDRHRSLLIQRISLVAAILDQLLDHKVVSQEQYATILAKATQQNQVRELYSGPLRSFLIEDLKQG
ncbi:NACHT, LRR and PYD domains-containing protein 1 [Merluccius polli]|uniref:NACHT, LRR and PYD domains-containing protein 1 n=1 Tax=Merluccius polli TaxID=89951 RepID=A0AA47MFG8_MERPO|nr:NACHT, LRR and PYD domains-containing protein 1 [Merluccius polli]